MEAIKQKKRKVTLMQIMDPPPKQILLNLVEREPGVDFKYYESKHFHNVEIIMAPEHALVNLIEKKPMMIYFHVNASTQKLEFFIDK